jgi:hypothetical protein
LDITERWRSEWKHLLYDQNSREIFWNQRRNGRRVDTAPSRLEFDRPLEAVFLLSTCHRVFVFSVSARVNTGDTHRPRKPHTPQRHVNLKDTVCPLGLSVVLTG